MSKITDLRGLFLHGLKDMYYAEQQSQKTLKSMLDKVSSSELKEQLSEHLDRSKTHISRLEQVFEIVGEKAEGVTCEAMDGILKEAKELMGEVEDAKTRDAAIIFSAQAIDHYEITRYGSLATFAEELGMQDASDLLADSLGDEEDADERLTMLAEQRVNEAAA